MLAQWVTIQLAAGIASRCDPVTLDKDASYLHQMSRQEINHNSVLVVVELSDDDLTKISHKIEILF